MSQTQTNPFSLAANPDPFDIHKECRALFLERLIDILKDATGLTREAQDAFRRGTGSHYDDMVAKTRKAGFEQAKGLTASRISLVGDDDLEIEIRLGDMIRRLNDAGGNELWRTYLRYQTLLRRSDLDKTENPVGPEAICAGLTGICGELGANLEQTLAALDKVEDRLIERLPALYHELNELLESRKVEAMTAQVNMAQVPSQPTRVPQAVPMASGGGGGIGGGNAANVPDSGPLLASLHQMLLARQPAAPSGYPASIMAGAPSLPGTTHAVGADPALTLSLVNQLLDRLKSLDSQQSIMPNLFAENGGEFEGVIKQSSLAAPRAVRAKDIGIQEGAPAAAIDAVGLVFEAIFEHPRLPDPIKMAIGSLQIPMLKASILDASFFDNNQHPARRLLDRMAQATVGLPRDISPSHPLCQSLQKIALEVRTHSPTDAAEFAPYEAEIDHLIAEHDAAAKAEAALYLPLAEQIDRELFAAALAKATLQASRVAGIHPGITDFLDTHWLNVLQAALLDGGEEGAAWQEFKGVASDLQWSTLPKPRSEDRKRLLSLVPGLLSRLNKGLDRIALDPAARQSFLDLCFNLQTAALRGSPVVIDKTETPPPADEAPATVSRVWSSDDRQILAITQAQDPCRSACELGPTLDTGWIYLAQPEGEPICAYLSWISPRTGAWLLTNPDRPQAIYLSRIMVERLWAAGRAKPASGESLFDSAAEKALRQIG